MKKVISLFIIGAASLFAGNVHAQQIIEAKPGSVLQHKSNFLSSGSKSLGIIDDRFEIIQVKSRGLDTPNLTVVMVYDKLTQSIVSGSSATGPGLGAAMVAGGAQAGASYLHRPDQTTVSTVAAGNADATGGNASAAGGSGSSSATGTGGTATGGNGGNGGSGNGGHNNNHNHQHSPKDGGK